MCSFTHPDVTPFTFVSTQCTPELCHSHGLTPDNFSYFLFVNPFTKCSLQSGNTTPYTENLSVSLSEWFSWNQGSDCHSRAWLQHSHCSSWPICGRFGADLRIMSLCIHKLREDRCREGRTALQDCTWEQIYADKGKGKDHTIACHEGREGEQRNSYTLSLTKALGGVGG
jgi:hypothetical protein